MIKLLAKIILLIGGWRAVGNAPDIDKYILIAAPHTSNWDLLLLLCFGALFNIRVSWMGKHTLFKPPHGWFLKAVGGIPVDRRSKHDVVAQTVSLIEARDRVVIAIPPEGTRSRAEYWKSGFYHIAHAAKVPIVITFLDYASKQGGFGPVIDSSGSPTEVMDKMREFYKGISGRFAENFGPVRLREET